MQLVAIDGPSGSGKSAVGIALAKKLQFLFFSAGEAYRALAALLVVTGMTVEEGLSMLENAEIQIIGNVGNEEFWVNGHNVTHLLHSFSVEALVAKISSIPEVRRRVERLQFEIANNPRGVVMEGRNIGTLFPDSFKFFLDANLSVRAQRRFVRDGQKQSIEEIETGLRGRDRLDSTRKHGRLLLLPDAFRVDSSRHTGGPEQTAQVMMGIIERNAPYFLHREAQAS